MYIVNDGRLLLNKTHLFPVLLDGRNEGMLASNTYVLIPVRPGRHAVVSSTAESQQGVEFDAEAGRNYFVRRPLRSFTNADTLFGASN